MDMRVAVTITAKTSAIVAALGLSIGAVLTLGGCGQRGPLYLPQVPPMPQRPADLQDTPSSKAAPDTGEVPDTSGQAVELAPDTELRSTPDAPKPASSAN
jgi:predicted small lipoprotein YifL